MGQGDKGGREPNDRDESDEPIAELRELYVEPSDAFAARLRRRIERRETSNHVLFVAWQLPLAVFMAFLEMTFSIFGSGPSDSGGSK